MENARRAFGIMTLVLLTMPSLSYAALTDDGPQVISGLDAVSLNLANQALVDLKRRRPEWRQFDVEFKIYRDKLVVSFIPKDIVQINNGGTTIGKNEFGNGADYIFDKSGKLVRHLPSRD